MKNEIATPPAAPVMMAIVGLADWSQFFPVLANMAGHVVDALNAYDETRGIEGLSWGVLSKDFPSEEVGAVMDEFSAID